MKKTFITDMRISFLLKQFISQSWLQIARELFLISILSQLFKETTLIDQTSPYTTHLLATINDSICHRKWTHKIEHVNTRQTANSSFLSRSHQKSFEFHRTCRRQHQNWRFCVLDKSPFSLRWEFTSVITCSIGHSGSGEIFNLVFDVHNFRITKATQTEKHVNLVHESITEAVFQMTKSIPNRRSFYNNTEGFIPITMIVLTLCQNINASIILRPMYKEDEKHNYRNLSRNKLAKIFNSPTIHPRMFARTLTNHDRFSYIESNKYVRVDSVDFNFVYCDEPRRENSKWWDLSIMVQAFEMKVWLMVLASLLICSIIISVSRVQISYPAHIFSASLALFVGLLGGNMNFAILDLKHSVLFTLWMTMSLILNNYYTGTMTSLLVKPLEEKVMSSLFDLDKHNYTVIFTDLVPSVYEVVNASANYEAPRAISTNASRLGPNH